jgi:hypothetical protein
VGLGKMSGGVKTGNTSGNSVRVLYDMGYHFDSQPPHGNRKNGFNSLNYRPVIVSHVIGLRPSTCGYDRPAAL